MHLGASQATEWNIMFSLHLELHRLCPSPTTHPPTSAPLNKAGDANVGVELLTGTTGVQPVPTHP